MPTIDGKMYALEKGRNARVSSLKVHRESPGVLQCFVMQTGYNGS